MNGIEFTIIKVTSEQDLRIVAVYRSPKIPVKQLCSAIVDILREHASQLNIFIGDFNVNWMVVVERQPLYNVMVLRITYLQIYPINKLIQVF